MHLTVRGFTVVCHSTGTGWLVPRLLRRRSVDQTVARFRTVLSTGRLGQWSRHCEAGRIPLAWSPEFLSSCAARAKAADLKPRARGYVQNADSEGDCASRSAYLKYALISQYLDLDHFPVFPTLHCALAIKSGKCPRTWKGRVTNDDASQTYLNRPSPYRPSLSLFFAQYLRSVTHPAEALLRIRLCDAPHDVLTALLRAERTASETARPDRGEQTSIRSRCAACAGTSCNKSPSPRDKQAQKAYLWYMPSR